MFGAGLSAGLVKGGGDNGYDENKQTFKCFQIKEIYQQALLDRQA